jgi:signal transduction histidine kinase
VGLVGVCRDISERKNMEAELLKVRKLESIGILAGGIAHDFNNLLMTILGNISLAKYLENKNLNQEKIIKVLEEAETASMRASELTKLLITFSKGGVPVKRAVSISDLIKNAVSFALNDADVTCNLMIPVDLWPVEVDEGQLKWVINNVVCNAQEATPAGGIISVMAQNITVSENEGFSLKNGRYVKISIKDTGVGILKENLVKIFDPYFTTKEMSSQKGIGLGLSICYSIIKSHDGTIAVESEIGVGTTVDIYLPT